MSENLTFSDAQLRAIEAITQYTVSPTRENVDVLIAALRASRERERRYEAALKRIAGFESRYGPGDEAQIARAALGEEDA